MAIQAPKDGDTETTSGPIHQRPTRAHDPAERQRIAGRKHYLSAPAAARVLGIAGPTIRAHAARGYIGERMGTRWQFRLEEIEAYKAYRNHHPVPRQRAADYELLTASDLWRWRIWRMEWNRK